MVLLVLFARMLVRLVLLDLFFSRVPGHRQNRQLCRNFVLEPSFQSTKDLYTLLLPGLLDLLSHLSLLLGMFEVTLVEQRRLEIQFPCQIRSLEEEKEADPILAAPCRFLYQKVLQLLEYLLKSCLELYHSDQKVC